jgi:hypothetical protein
MVTVQQFRDGGSARSPPSNPGDPALDPRTAYIEEATGCSWVEEGHVAELVEIYSELMAMTLPADETLTRLREIIRSL